jgi:hypothetical protein
MNPDAAGARMEQRGNGASIMETGLERIPITKVNYGQQTAFLAAMALTGNACITIGDSGSACF